jgi:hypothetical protein
VKCVGFESCERIRTRTELVARHCHPNCSRQLSKIKKSMSDIRGIYDYYACSHALCNAIFCQSNGQSWQSSSSPIHMYA